MKYMQSGSATLKTISRVEGHLARLTVDLAVMTASEDVEVGINPRTERAEGVEALGARPLIVRSLQVAAVTSLPTV